MKHTMLQQMNTTKTACSFSSFPVNQTKNIQPVLHRLRKISVVTLSKVEGSFPINFNYED